MFEYDRRDLVCLYLAALGGRHSPVSAALTATGVADALEIGETAVGRVDLLETLTTLQEEGLVVADERPVEGSESPRPVYGLSDAGRTRAAATRDRVTEQPVVVTNGTRKEVTLADIGEYIDSEAPLVTALVRLDDDGELSLDRYTGEGFVGRESELEALRDSLESSFPGESETVLVTGASGMGKTALVQEALTRVHERYPELLVARGSSPDGTTDPYRAFQQLFGTIDAERGTDLRERLVDTQTGVSPEDSTELRTQRQALFDDIADELQAAATDPIVLFLDNLHWADEATLALFEHLVTTLDAWLAPVAFVGTYREPAVAGTDHPLTAILARIEDQRPYTRVQLDPLSRTGTRALLADVLGSHDLPEAFVALIHEQTGGNPLFVRETATYLLETDAVDPDADVFPTARSEVTLPAAVTDQIASRLEHLDDESRDLLRLGAVVGERIPDVVLERASDLPGPRYREYVDLLVASRVWERVETTETAPASGGDLQFVSGGLREAVVDRLPAASEASYHERVAHAFERVYGEASAEHAARIAHHYEQAGDDERAVASYRLAGDHASETYAHEDAIEHYERALALAEGETVPTTTVAAIADELGDVFELIGEYNRAREYYERGLENRRAAGDRAGEAASLNNLGSVATKRGAYDEAGDYYEESLTIAQATGARDVEARSLHDLGNIALVRGGYDEASEYYEQSIVIKRELGDQRGEAKSHHNLGMLAERRGAYDEAGDYFEVGLDIFRELGDRQGEANSIQSLGNIAYYRGSYDQAREYYEDALALFREVGDRQGEAETLTNLGLVAKSRDQYVEASTYYEESLDIFQEIGDRNGEAESLRNLGGIAEQQGDYDRAQESYEESLAIKQDLGERRGEAANHNNLGSLANHRGEYEQAREYFEDALALSREIGDQNLTAMSLTNLGDVASERDEFDTAREYLREALALFEDVGAPQDTLSTLESLVDTCRQQGDDKQAAAYREQAERVFVDAPDPVKDQFYEWLGSDE